jgi:CMP-N,N'-diacetyllegionaminic acid synthase
VKHNFLERKLKVAALIPSRMGSKGIPGKNKTDFAGKPLIEYTLDAALQAEGLGGCFLSSDDPWVMAFAEDKGVTVPFKRPDYLAGDDVPMVDVVRHFLDWADEAGQGLDAVMLLQPTSPLRTSGHIEEALNLYRMREAETLVSVTRLPHAHVPQSIMREEEGYLVPYMESFLTRRQDKPEYFARNGPAILISSRSAILKNELYAPPCVGYPMRELDSVDVDDPETLVLAELCLKVRERRSNGYGGKET